MWAAFLQLLQKVSLEFSSVAPSCRWLAPEVLGGDAGGLPADVWAFGTVLWELMTWAPPFDGLNPYQVLALLGCAAMRRCGRASAGRREAACGC